MFREGPGVVGTFRSRVTVRLGASHHREHDGVLDALNLHYGVTVEAPQRDVPPELKKATGRLVRFHDFNLLCEARSNGDVTLQCQSHLTMLVAAAQRLLEDLQDAGRDHENTKASQAHLEDVLDKVNAAVDSTSA